MLESRRAFIVRTAAMAAAVALPTRAAAATGEPQPSARGRPDVLVIGAGLAGLNAALHLEEAGATVRVLEGRDRIGGRVHSLKDQPGYPEMGANTMASGYGRTLAVARSLGLPLMDVNARMRRMGQLELAIDGALMKRDEWALSARNPFPEALRSVMPWELVSRVFASASPLKDWTQWASPANAALDVSVHDFLAGQGLDDASIQLAFDTSPYYGTNAYEVSALMYEFNGGWIKALTAAGPISYAIAGGNQLLPEAMARSLKGDVLLGHEVVAIDSGTDVAGSYATVQCRDGRRFEAKRIVCALPFSTLRQIRIDPPLSGMQARAVRTLPYQTITLMFFTADRPFWEADGRSPSMWTDGPAGSVLAQYFGRDENEVTGFVVHGRGQLGMMWDRLGKTEAMRLVQSEIERIRPAARGRLRPVTMHSWALDRFNAGDWAVFQPGTVAPFMSAMANVHRRLHFCGEHTAFGSRGMEGAMESGERAAIEVLDRL